jgi:hypothetical protein
MTMRPAMRRFWRLECATHGDDQAPRVAHALLRMEPAHRRAECPAEETPTCERCLRTEVPFYSSPPATRREFRWVTSVAGVAENGRNSRPVEDLISPMAALALFINRQGGPATRTTNVALASGRSRCSVGKKAMRRNSYRSSPYFVWHQEATNIAGSGHEPAGAGRQGAPAK